MLHIISPTKYASDLQIHRRCAMQGTKHSAMYTGVTGDR